jgi:hypothetical protein
MKHVLILLLAALLLTSVPAAATTIITNTYWVPGPLQSDDLPADWAAVVNLQQFNPSQGILTGVTVTMTGFWDNAGIVTITNTGTGSVTFSIQDSLRFDLGGAKVGGVVQPGPGGLQLSASQLLYMDSPFNGLSHTLSPGQHTTITPSIASGSTGSSSAVGSANWGVFEGTGTVAYDVYLSDLFGIFSFGGSELSLGFQGSAPGRAEITVEYQYDLIPEPATMAFAGLGLLALGFLGRRFARR